MGVGYVGRAHPSSIRASPLHAISEQTIYAWRKRFGKLEAADVERLRQLGHENLKRSDAGLQRWIERGAYYATSLPTK